MAGIVYTKLIDALKGIGVDVSQQSGSNVKKLAPKNKSTATKPGLLAAERDTGGNFGTVLEIFKNEAKYIDSMNDAEQMAFLNNILDYNEFGGKSIGVSKGIEATDAMKDFKNTQSELKKALEELNTSAKSLKDEAEAGKKKALEDLDTFMETGGQPFKKKDDKFLGGSMHEESQIRTGIRQFLQNEYKNGRINLDDTDKFRVMEYSPMIEDDPILVFKKIYGDEAYKKAGTFPGAFEVGENYKHYEQIFRENMGEDLLKVKDKKYIGDGKLVLTEMEEIKPPIPDDDVPFAKGGRAGFYMGGQSGQSVIEPDLSDIGHGSDSLMSRTRMLSPNAQATTSTGLNYLLGEDNDNTRVPFNDGLLVPPAKPYTKEMFEDDSMTLLKGMYGTGPESNTFLYNKMIEKGNILRKQGVERETVIEIIRNNKDKINAFLEKQTTSPKSLAGLAEGGRIGFQDGLSAAKKYGNILVEDETLGEMAGKELKSKISEFIPNETEKEKKEREMFQMVKEYQKFKRNNPDLNMSFRMFSEQKKKEKELFKNKIVELDLKYPEKEIIDKETNMVNTENLKKAIDEAEIDLELSPIDGLTLKRTINTEGEQSVTSGSFSLDNLTFSSPNLEEGKLTTTGNFDFGGLNLSGMVNSNDGEILNTELGFNYDNMLTGKLNESDGYRSTELDLNKTFPISDKFNLNLTGDLDTQTFNGKTYKSSDLKPTLSYNDGIFNADISKSILEGGDTPNLNVGASFPLFKKTFTGDLILNEKGEPTYNSDGSLKRKSDYSTDMGVVTLKGTDLFTDNMGGTIGYQKEFGNRDDNFYFTAGGEIEPFSGEKTFGLGLKKTFADGGIADLRQGYNKGNIVDKGRRGFLKLLGITAGGVAALKTGLVKILGKDSGAISKKVIDEVIIDGSTGAPSWLQPLVNKALRDGIDKTKNLAYKDAQEVKRLDTPTGQVDVYYDVRTGEVEIDYIGGNTALGESVNMRYTPGIADEGTRGKPADEFSATESIPEGRQTGPDDYDIEMGENTVGDVKGLFSDTTELAELGGEKILTKDIVETIKKKKTLKKMEDNPVDFVTDVQGDYDPT